MDEDTKTEAFALLLCTDLCKRNMPLKWHMGRAASRKEGDFPARLNDRRVKEK